MTHPIDKTVEEKAGEIAKQFHDDKGRCGCYPNDREKCWFCSLSETIAQALTLARQEGERIGFSKALLAVLGEGRWLWHGSMPAYKDWETKELSRVSPDALNHSNGKEV